MRIKKGFTLAEILIVLMVIGVIAMLTIPSMMKGVTEAQLKAGYKKAYNTVVNVAAMERVSGGLPTRAKSEQAADFFHALANNLSVKYYVDAGDTAYAPDSGSKINGSSGTLNAVSVGKLKVGAGEAGVTVDTISGTISDTGITGVASPWIVTEDGIGYSVILGNHAAESDCGTKATINAAESPTAAAAESCVIVIADVNGLAKGPNTFEKQIQTATGTATATGVNKATSGANLYQLVGDQYLIYVGQDGATSGPMSTTVTGRLVGDVK